MRTQEGVRAEAQPSPEAQTGRQTGRQTEARDRQTDRETDRQTDRQPDEQTDGQTDRQGDRETGRQTSISGGHTRGSVNVHPCFTLRPVLRTHNTGAQNTKHSPNTREGRWQSESARERERGERRGDTHKHAPAGGAARQHTCRWSGTSPPIPGEADREQTGRPHTNTRATQCYPHTTGRPRASAPRPQVTRDPSNNTCCSATGWEQLELEASYLSGN